MRKRVEKYSLQIEKHTGNITSLHPKYSLEMLTLIMQGSCPAGLKTARAIFRR